ncbi:hypothetical protein SARC_00548 [Sphaeroforma arctica JP610]|uniref:Uncharacterized protein n=1 Tax=Sphaeroforma arctica JP610 TaxID=667725 RepID=A0A0L0GGC2_9EUKA|nr:hypothetical protein SARC_00548 [Sphaeroforma arctica JP610]KNC87358.1 hypothetical protein SARC_00548 [Sphaeroforma arctica JP610]|eukprot:XP_014161260.1 hypothetical protein SARC_00548 [Sphaeroforma arctica JP610]
MQYLQPYTIRNCSLVCMPTCLRLRKCGCHSYHSPSRLLSLQWNYRNISIKQASNTCPYVCTTIHNSISSSVSQPYNLPLIGARRRTYKSLANPVGITRAVTGLGKAQANPLQPSVLQIRTDILCATRRNNHNVEPGLNVRTHISSRHKSAVSHPLETDYRDTPSFPRLSEVRLRLQGLVSGITADSLDVSTSEAYDILDEVDEGMLLEVEADLRASGSVVVASTRHVSVLDQLHGAGLGVALRSLHFNDRLDLVQTCVKVCMKTGEIFHSHPPPSLGERSTHLQGLALGLVLQQASVLFPNATSEYKNTGNVDHVLKTDTLQEADTAASLGSEPATVRTDVPQNVSASTIFPFARTHTHTSTQHFKLPPCRVAVLGAGGCSLPGFLHELLPYVYLDCVESHADVIAMARNCFGVRELEETSARFHMHETTAEKWIDEEFTRQYSSRDVSSDVSPFDLMAAYTKYTTLLSETEKKGVAVDARNKSCKPLDLVIIDIENGDMADLIFGMRPTKGSEQSRSSSSDTSNTSNDACAPSESVTHNNKVCVDVGGVSGDDSSQGYCLIAPPESILESSFMTKVCASVGPYGVVAMNVLGTEEALLKVRERLNARVPTGWTKSRCTATEVSQTRHGNIKHCIVMLRNGPQVDRSVLVKVVKAMPNVLDDSTYWFDSWVEW